METSGQASANLKLNTEVVKKLLIDFIRDEVSSAGFSKGIVGLSGGVDSTLVTYLSADALGKENVLAVLMPYKTSTPDSIADAKTVGEKLGIRHEIVDISPMVDAYISRNGEMDNVRKGNVMARMRMIVLYDLSSRERSLVIGTSNKTEILLGYGTLFGDVACAINPIGDLYKTQVWQLAEAAGVPKHIVEKKPTADLWVGQTDEGELGFSYKLVDQLLYYMVDERRSDTELQNLGFEKHFIEKVKVMVQRNQFKRRPPVIAKVTHRTVNVDFRYARDWGL
ncbi:MAG: NAD+ synthase [Ignavibacteriae bacterium]|nr:NAD+ synthase [Ignavibacteriota bacterium]